MSVTERGIGGNGGSSPARIIPRAVTNSMLVTLVQMLRCVPSTPFGWLVVPDV
jgi:hypothetical protein